MIGYTTPLSPGMTLSSVSKTLERAFAIKPAKAVAIIVNSPGGSVTGSVVGGGNVLPVSGRPNGTATLFNVAADGTATAGATVTPFPGFTTGNVRSARGDVVLFEWMPRIATVDLVGGPRP